MRFSVVHRLGCALTLCIATLASSSLVGAPLLGDDFPVLPKASYSLGTWELQPGPNARSYTRDEINALGLFSLRDLLRWDGVLDLSEDWGPWTGDGVSLDGRSTQGCLLVLFNGHPLTTSSSDAQTTLSAFSLKRATRVDILVGVSAGLYGSEGCEVVVSVVDDGREPGLVLDTSWQSLSGANLSAMLRRKLDDLVMSAGVTYQTFDDAFSGWKSFRDLERGTAGAELPEFSEWGAGVPSDLPSELFEPRGQASAYDFYYRVEVGDFRLSWNNSVLSTQSARGLDPAGAVYGDDFETSSQESLYLSYVTDAGDGSWRFYWNLSYGLASISPETELSSAMSDWERRYAYRDEKTLLLEEYMLWELSSWASLFVGGGAGFGVVTPRTSLLSEPVDTAAPVSEALEVDGALYPVATQLSYRNLFGYGHLTFGNAEGPRLQIGGRFDSDSRDALFLSPRLSLALPLVDDWSWTLASELAKRALPLRQRLVSDVVFNDTLLWERSADPSLKRGTFLQVESSLSTNATALKVYYRADEALASNTPTIEGDTPEMTTRSYLGWNLEKSFRYLELNSFASYRGWATELDSRRLGHRVIVRFSAPLAGLLLSQRLWVQHGDTVANNPWSGGLDVAVSRSLDEVSEGLRLWSKAYIEQRRSRLSLEGDTLLPLPRARVGGLGYGGSVGLELQY